MTITYRQATPNDEQALNQCLQEIVAAERPMDECLQDGFIQYYDPLKFLSSDNTQLIVAESEHGVVACGAAEIRNAKAYYHYHKTLYLAMMYVNEDYRGTGINAQIIEGLLSWGKSKGVENAMLTVYPQNASAIKAYEKLGFETALLEMRLRK